MKKILLVLLLIGIMGCGKDKELEKAEKEAEIERLVEEKLAENKEKEAEIEKKVEERLAEDKKKKTEKQTTEKKASTSSYKADLLNRTKSIDKEYDLLGDYEYIDDMNELGGKWDTELNKVYQAVMARLSEKEKQKLKIEQRQWISDRNAEINATGDLLMHADIFYNMTKKRTIELATLYDKL